MSQAEHGLEMARAYLTARRNFKIYSETEEMSQFLGGNDNYVGRIGEFLAMLYLEEFHGLSPEVARGRKRDDSRKSVDLLVDEQREEWWSVKCVTDENQKGRTSPYCPIKHEKQGWYWPPLILIKLSYLGTQQQGRTGFRAQCIAYPQGLVPLDEAKNLNSGEKSMSATSIPRGRALATKTRFRSEQERDGVELALFDSGAWKRVRTFIPKPNCHERPPN